jgi:hypothetical protein
MNATSFPLASLLQPIQLICDERGLDLVPLLRAPSEPPM